MTGDKSLTYLCFPSTTEPGKVCHYFALIYTIKFYQQLYINLHDHHFPYQVIYEASNTQTIMIKAVVVIDDYNVFVIYKSYNNCTQRALF